MADQPGKIVPLTINMNPGRMAPRWDAATHELTPLSATVTEQGMKTGWPMVDILFDDVDGKRHVYTTSGRMMLALAGAIQAAVIRNKHEPDYVPVLLLALQGTHPQTPAVEKAVEEIATALHNELLGLTPTVEGFKAALSAVLISLLQR